MQTPEGKEITNKEIIDRLVKYYLKQDPAIVARLLANACIDFRRLVNFEQLDVPEGQCLLFRMELNAKELEKFIIDENYDRPLKGYNIESQGF